MDDLSLILKAQTFATEAHRGVYRKPPCQDEPYIEHPKRVAARLFNLGFRPAVVAAAWLHDVIEDTEVTELAIFELFGEEVTKLVMQVTHVSRLEDGNRAVRRLIDRLHLARSSRDGASIKLSDIIDNMASPFHSYRWAAKYFDEKRAEIDVLLHGDSRLLEQAYLQHAAGPVIVREPCTSG